MLRRTYLHCLLCFYTYLKYANNFRTKYKVFLLFVYFSTECTVAGRFLIKKMSLALSYTQTKGRGILLIQLKHLYEILVETHVLKVLGAPGIFVSVVTCIVGWVCLRKSSFNRRA